MGYESHVRGEITITPPLAWHEYRDSDFRSERAANRDLVLLEKVDVQQTLQGEVTIRMARAIAARFEDARNFYSMKDELAAVAATFPGHIFEGYLVRTGADQGNVERYWVDGAGKVQSERARLIWPDGSDVEPPSAFG